MSIAEFLSGRPSAEEIRGALEIGRAMRELSREDDQALVRALAEAQRAEGKRK